MLHMYIATYYVDVSSDSLLKWTGVSQQIFIFLAGLLSTDVKKPVSNCFITDKKEKVTFSKLEIYHGAEKHSFKVTLCFHG